METRIINLLEKAGIYTVGELLATPREELLERPNFGQRSLEKVLAAMAELGFVEEESDHG